MAQLHRSGKGHEVAGFHSKLYDIRQVQDSTHKNIHLAKTSEIIQFEELYMTKIERRKEIRISQGTTFKFDIAQPETPPQLTKEGHLVDYSIAGIRFITDTPLEKNISLLLQLDLANFKDEGVDWRKLWDTGTEKYLNMIGSVMWCLAQDGDTGKFEVGTRFSHKAQSHTPLP
jgi:hypothetical protein